MRNQYGLESAAQIGECVSHLRPAQIAPRFVKLLGKIAFLRSHKSELTGLTKDPGAGPMTPKTFINNFWLKEMIFSIFNSARHGEPHYGN